jgi:hypothetical protein
MSQAKTVAGARRSKKYKVLTQDPQFNLSDVAALAVLGFTVDAVPEPEVDPDVARLVETGAFTPEEAEAAIREVKAMSPEPATPTEDEPAPEPTAPKVELTSEEKGDALVAEHGLKFTRGRVYLTADDIEAAVRVRKTGSPEIVQSSGVGHTKAILFFGTPSGAVAAQNLTKSA